MAHITKDKCDIGLAFAIAYATKQGWSCAICISEHQKYDFIAEKNGICKRVQVKYVTPANDKLEVKLSSSWIGTKENSHINRKQGDYDTLAVYCPESDRVFFVDDKEFDNVKSISLRLKLPKNNQTKGIRMACDYLILT